MPSLVFQKKCIRLNIPQDDDAHLVFLALPSPAAEGDEDNSKWVEDQKKMEEYFVSQTLELTKNRVHKTLPRKFRENPPEAISKLTHAFLDEYFGELKTGCKIKITNPRSTSTRTMETFWFTPVVINHLRKAVRTRKDEWEATPLEGYEICFSNTHDEPMQMIIESIMTSEEPGASDSGDESPAFESAHLTPLAEQLGESIASAESVLKEMNYMEKRESRMRLTADSINKRVRYFSYISVAVLLVVTYLQVSYLKRYFRKKKLL
jgi:hypothetical protein